MVMFRIMVWLRFQVRSLPGVWLNAKETEISAALSVTWLGKYFTDVLRIFPVLTATALSSTSHSACR